MGYRVSDAVGKDSLAQLAQEVSYFASPVTVAATMYDFSTSSPKWLITFTAILPLSGGSHSYLRACIRLGCAVTILIDLERGTVIDLLPGRDGEALKVWLASNPQVEVITRDRWPAYIQAATTAAA